MRASLFLPYLFLLVGVGKEHLRKSSLDVKKWLSYGLLVL